MLSVNYATESDFIASLGLIRPLSEKLRRYLVRSLFVCYITKWRERRYFKVYWYSNTYRVEWSVTVAKTAGAGDKADMFAHTLDLY